MCQIYHIIADQKGWELCMSEKAWLDVSVFKCPKCGRYYVDASWYVAELESDIECGTCHELFNTKKQSTDRLILGFGINSKGKVLNVEVFKRINSE